MTTSSAFRYTIFFCFALFLVFAQLLALHNCIQVQILPLRLLLLSCCCCWWLLEARLGMPSSSAAFGSSICDCPTFLSTGSGHLKCIQAQLTVSGRAIAVQHQ